VVVTTCTGRRKQREGVLVNSETASTAMSAMPATDGPKNERFRLSTELLRQAMSGPTP